MATIMAGEPGEGDGDTHAHTRIRKRMKILNPTKRHKEDESLAVLQVVDFQACNEGMMCVVFQRRTPVRSCCAPSRKRWVSTAGPHFGPGVKFPPHSGRKSIRCSLNIRNSPVNMSVAGVLPPGLFAVCLCTERSIEKYGSCSDYLFSCSLVLSSLFGVIEAAQRGTANQ